MDLDRQMGLRPTEGTIVAGRHLLPMRVYYEDTDWSGVVYHASYLRFLERGRTEFLRAAGVDQSILHAEGEGLTFAVRRMTIDYLRAARMDDVLLVETHTGEVRGASLVIAQRILRGDEIPRHGRRARRRDHRRTPGAHPGRAEGDPLAARSPVRNGARGRRLIL